MKRAKLRSSRSKPKRKAPRKTVVIDAAELRKLIRLAAGATARSPRTSKPKSPKADAAPRGAASHLTHAQMVARAREAVLGPMLKDLRDGKIDQEDVDFWAERRAEDIAAHVAAQKRGQLPPPRCADCIKPSTAIKGGVPYCTAHAAQHTEGLPG